MGAAAWLWPSGAKPGPPGSEQYHPNSGSGRSRGLGDLALAIEGVLAEEGLQGHGAVDEIDHPERDGEGLSRPGGGARRHGGDGDGRLGSAAARLGTGDAAVGDPGP